ncbi:MAG: tail fiber domain-containing protein [Pseudomonadota bacterium]|nr:tail fiber domain-containing protein [Pseudomonadota bacterium]
MNPHAQNPVPPVPAPQRRATLRWLCIPLLLVALSACETRTPAVDEPDSAPPAPTPLPTPASVAEGVNGVDLSRSQGGEMNVAKIKQAGKLFVFVKPSQGATLVDPDHARNVQQARAAGLAVGSFHFYDSDDTPHSRVSTRAPLPKKGTSLGADLNWTNCAQEGGTCSLSGTTTVRYGAGSRYMMKTFTSSITCGIRAFGLDPNPNVLKSCDILEGPISASWLYCGTEGNQCEVTDGPKFVRYGANGVYAIKTASSSINCGVAGFNFDPVPGIVKSCSVLGSNYFQALASSPFTTLIGYNALVHNTTGAWNTAYGYASLFYNTSGDRNTAIGGDSLLSNTTGSYNTAMGTGALEENTTGIRNTAIGYHALTKNTGPSTGCSSIEPTKCGTSNTAVGYEALQKNTTGWQNTAVGESALTSNTKGSHNTAIGEDALNLNQTGAHNTASGESALYDNISGNNNVANGYFALNHALGNNNVAVGYQAGRNLVSGNNHIYIGNPGDASDPDGVIRIGEGGIHTGMYVAGVSGTTVTGAQVFISANGQLGVQQSSKRFKKDIRALGKNRKLLGLRPVSYRYKQADETGAYPLQYGLLAEEVAEVFPELVQYDESGKPLAVHYTLLIPLLVAEVQREHDENQKQQSSTAELLNALTREVAALRQKVSAQASR